MSPVVPITPNATGMTEERVGGKAMGLFRLVSLGLPVPPAVVVTVDDEGSFETLPDAVSALGEPLAVRSSAVGEDAADRSAAGQFESVMGVTANGVAEAVRTVRASATSGRVAAYRGKAAVPMAVIIQREVRSTRAGVAFSRDPFTGDDTVVVECVFGHGERLVSGTADPDRFRVHPDGSVEARLAVKEGSLRLARTLRDDEVAAVARLTRQAETGFGRAVDVEFCFDSGGLWLVQARPITAL